MQIKHIKFLLCKIVYGHYVHYTTEKYGTYQINVNVIALTFTTQKLWKFNPCFLNLSTLFFLPSPHFTFSPWPFTESILNGYFQCYMHDDKEWEGGKALEVSRKMQLFTPMAKICM